MNQNITESEQIRHGCRNPIVCLRHQINQLVKNISEIQKQIARMELALSPERYMDEVRRDGMDIQSEQ